MPFARRSRLVVLVAVVAVVVLVGLSALAGCGGGGAFGQLPAAEQARFDRCWSSIAPEVCGTREGSGAATSACRERGETQYAAEPTPDARASYLTENGCID